MIFMQIIIPELSFFLVAVPAVLMTGIDKGGLGSVLGMLAVPLMSLVMPPLQAVVILLPLLLVMDGCAIWGWRHSVDWKIMRTILAPGLMGVLLGVLIFSKLSENILRFLIGFISIAFCFYQWFFKTFKVQKPCRIKGGFWSLVSGFSSFGVHAGGVPLSIYMLPLRLDKAILTGTMAIFFGIINLAKIPAYGGLGQLTMSNALLSLLLLPLCPIGVRIGMYLVHRINEQFFYKILYIGLFITGLKLIFDAVGV